MGAEYEKVLGQEEVCKHLKDGQGCVSGKSEGSLCVMTPEGGEEHLTAPAEQCRFYPKSHGKP